MSSTLQEVQAPEKTYHGFVLDIDERNGYDDSDFFAIVWDEELQMVRRIEDGTTRSAAPARYHGADAPVDIRAKASQYMAEHYFLRQARQALINEAETFKFGSDVVVVHGRKVPIGSRGEVVWLGKDPYYRAPRYFSNSLGLRLFDAKEYRVGIRLPDGSKAYTNLSNVEMASVEIPTADQIKAKARSMWHGNFRTAMNPIAGLAGIFSSKVKY